MYTAKQKDKYNSLPTDVLVQIILKKEDTITALETKLRHIEQYLDDFDDIDYLTMKYEIESILKEKTQCKKNY